MLKAASLLAVGLMVAAIAGLYLQHSLFGTHPIAIAVQAAAILLMIWARITFGGRSFHAAANPTAGGVVSTGPYAYVRHPIYAAAIYFTWAGALNHASWKTIVCAAAVTAGGFIRMSAEERLVVARYPEYRAYMSRVRRILPFVY